MFGAAGYRVTGPADPEDVFAQALQEENPVIVKLVCDPDVFREPSRKDTIRAERTEISETVI